MGARWFFLRPDLGRVLLRCGKGVTNQQWSIVGVVNNFLDPQRVQYSLLPQGDIDLIKFGLRSMWSAPGPNLAFFFILNWYVWV